MRALTPEALDELVLLGAHCDDIPIGAGGTVLTLCRARPGLRVRALVLAGGGTARLVPPVFRDPLALGYEILKAEPDLSQPAVLWPLDDDVVAEKSRLLHEHYPSQTGRAWFDDEMFRRLARVRGVQAGVRYAEGFHPTRLVVGAPLPSR